MTKIAYTILKKKNLFLSATGRGGGGRHRWNINERPDISLFIVSLSFLNNLRRVPFWAKRWWPTSHKLDNEIFYEQPMTQW